MSIIDTTNDIKSLRIDLVWGFLDQNLEKEEKSKEEIEKIKAEFSAHFLDENRPINDWMREVYQKILLPAKEQRELIKRICLYLKERVEKLFKATWNGEPGSDQKALAELEEELKQQMNNLILLNQPEVISSYFYRIYDEKNQILADKLSQQVWASCQRGEPGFLNLLAIMLNKRKFQYVSLANKEPINDVKRSLQILHRLVDLRVKDSPYILTLIYKSNEIGDDKNEVKLDFSIEQRLAAMKKLTETGDYGCQEQWKCILSFGSIVNDKIKLSPAERKSCFQQLIRTETNFSYWSTNYYYDNGGYDFEAGLDISACLAMLKKLARNGNKCAYLDLIETYSTGQIGNMNIRVLKIKTQTRWEKLQRLKSIDIQFWTESMAPIYLQGYLELYDKGKSSKGGPSKNGWPIPLSLAKRYKWLTDNIKYNMKELCDLFCEYGDLAEEDRAENLRSVESRLIFCYKLALSDKKAEWAVKYVRIMLSFPISQLKKWGIELGDEDKINMMEKLALAGHSMAQSEYYELIKDNPIKYVSNTERLKKIGKVAILARREQIAGYLIKYSGRSTEEAAILRRLLNYRQVLYDLDQSCELSAL